MPFESDEFDMLYSRAMDFRNASRYADSAVLLERALKTAGGTEEKKLRARLQLADCFRMLGRYTEAMAYYGEVYTEANDSKHHELTFRSLINQIECLEKIQDIQQTGTHTNLNKRKEIIEEGLLWLRDIDREKWRPSLLLRLAEVINSLGEEEEALGIAEEAYRLEKRFDAPGYTLINFAAQVSRFARNLGNYERSLQVLDEIEKSEISPYGLSILLSARVNVLREMDPPRLTEAIDAARRATRVVDEIQEPRRRLFTYMELADIAIAVQSFDEARDALHMIREIALGNETIDRTYQVRRARYSFRRARNAISGDDDGAARKLYQMLGEWLEEIEEALEALEE